MSRIRSWISLVLACGAIASACSAIIDPDEGRLRPGADAGMRPDSSVPPDGGPVCPASCDDGIACTEDACIEGRCDHAPDDGACADGERCNAVTGCVPLRCTTDAECGDGNACNGTERCDPTSSTDPSGCVEGTAVTCDDGLSCTDESCDPESGECIVVPFHDRCDDTIPCTTDACTPGALGDGCTHTPDDSLCNDGFCNVGGTCNPITGCVGSSPRDCDDGDRCDVESCDATAMACVSAPRDDDMDGHPIARSGGDSCAGDDCDDTSSEVHPGATELCDNRRDDDCDTSVDEGCVVTTPGDTCPAAIMLTLDSAGRASASGRLSTYDDDLTMACGNSGGHDVVYAFDLGSTSDVIISTTGSADGVDTVLGVGFDCPTGPIVCNDDGNPGAETISRIFLHRVAPRRVYVYVDGYDGTELGDYRLNVQRLSPRPDACTTEMLDISVGGTVLGTGGLAASTMTYSGSCQSFTERSELEGIFRMRLPGDNNLNRIAVRTIDLTTGGGGSFTPDVHVRTSGCSSGTEIACETGEVTLGPFAVTADSYLFVDGMLGASPTGSGFSYVVDYDP